MKPHPVETARRAARGPEEDRLPGVAVLLAAALFACLYASSSPAQSTGSAPSDLATAAESAAATLSKSAKDSLLVRDLLGAEVTAPGGDVSGTVQDLVVVPGGRIVAAIVEPKAKGADPVPVPFAAVKVKKSASRLQVELPEPLSSLKSDKSVAALAKAIPGFK
ncbi:PRC-barrel domain-containing protein [Chthonobacter rhizosphaerae]|uniref:PRC-barrel domain-containing protein n=1 Tax=Chthonobacter rhizosphaerae TaxID=2735553 RepID=UPI0015EECE93|nr:PRC-barrel domain-containing protein [Chthonobacter rhizosphaerae]